MNKLIKPAILVLAIGFAFTSCKKATPEEQANRIIHNGAILNEDAILIYSLDGFALLDKANLSKIPNVSGYAPMVTMFTEKYRKPESYGAKISGKIHFVVVGDMNKSSGYGFTSFAVTDPSKLQKSLKDDFMDMEMTKEENFTLGKMGNDFIVLWDESVAVVLASSYYNGDLAEEARKIIKYREEKLIKHEQLTAYLQHTSEISGFAFVEKSLEMVKFQDDIKIDAGLQAALKDAYSEFHISFETGKAVFEQINHISKITESPYNVLNAGGVNEKLMKFLSAEGSPIGMMGMKLNLNNLITIMDAYRQDDKKPSEELSKEIGWTSDKFTSVFTGDFGFALNNFVLVKPQPDETMKDFLDDPFFAELYSQPQPTPIVSIVIGIKDKPAILELVEKNKEKMDERGVIDMGDIKLFINNEMMLFSGDARVIDNAVSGKPNGKLIGNTSSPIFGLFDGKSFTKNVDADVMNMMAEQGLNKETLNMIDRVEMSFSIAGGKMEFILSDQSKNSMEVFATQVGKIIVGSFAGGMF